MKQKPHYLSLGAGVQSSALALMATHGLIEPMPVAAIFADTQAEPASVYRWLDWLEGKLAFPVFRVTAGSLTEESLRMRVSRKGSRYSRTSIPFFTRSKAGEVGKIPHRSCTADFKLRPILKRLRKEIGAKSIARWWRDRRQARSIDPLATLPPLAVQYVGISLDEMQRMKDSRDPWVAVRWPLVEQRITRADCIRWMAANGYPEPPRSSCVYCPFHNNAEWLRMQREEPEEFERAVQFERDVQAAKSNSCKIESTPFLHRSAVPLDQVDFRSRDEKSGQQQLPFEDECEGMCGV